MITGFEAHGYRCLEDVKVEGIPPLAAFIGPNNSGKSTLLTAVQQAVVRRGMELSPEDEFRVRVFPLEAPPEADVKLGSPHVTAFMTQLSTGWPDATSLLCSGYDGLGSFAIEAISNDLARLFPHVKRVEGRTATRGPRLVQADGWHVPLALVPSEGVRQYLAFAALPYLDLPPLLLVETLERGLHPHAVQAVVTILRGLTAPERQRPVQVILTTYSPLVVNELRPEEVFLVTRPVGAGTRVTPFTQTKNLKERLKTYALGELWLSFGDTTDEALLEDGAR